MSVCSCGPATTLDSRHESLTRFVQQSLVHLVRHSLNFCGWKDRKAVAKDLRRIYQATDDGEAEKALADFEAEWGSKYPSIAPSWRRARQEVIPFFCFSTSGPQNHLHHQCDRKPQSRHPQNHQNARQLPNRRCRDKADLSRDLRLQIIRPASVSPPPLDLIATPNNPSRPPPIANLRSFPETFWQTRHPSEVRIINGTGTTLKVNLPQTVARPTARLKSQERSAAHGAPPQRPCLRRRQAPAPPFPPARPGRMQGSSPSRGPCGKSG